MSSFFKNWSGYWVETPKVLYFKKSILREFEGAFTIEKHPQYQGEKMIALTVENVKQFMHLLFKTDVFDKYEIHQAIATTFTTFEVTGDINESFFDEENKPQRKFCTWDEIRPFIFSVIKGSKLPKHMKIVLSAPEELRNNLCENASALFINVNYENNILTIITGYSLKTFSLNKDHEIIWDNFVEDFIKENNISVSTQL